MGGKGIKNNFGDKPMPTGEKIKVIAPLVGRKKGAHADGTKVTPTRGGRTGSPNNRNLTTASGRPGPRGEEFLRYYKQVLATGEMGEAESASRNCSRPNKKSLRRGQDREPGRGPISWFFG